jgi:transposase InsO family protein
MIAIARERRRFGYRRLHVLLKREGHLVNHKRLFRLYREEKLAVRRRGGRKSAGRWTLSPISSPVAAASGSWPWMTARGRTWRCSAAPRCLCCAPCDVLQVRLES